MRSPWLLFLGASVVLLAGNTWAASYYVDSANGDDAFDGQSENPASGNQGPWKTIGRVNSATFEPGDDIYFKRDSVFTDATLRVRHNGTASDPATFGAYGSGAKPLFDCGPNNVLGGISFSGQDREHIVIQDLAIHNVDGAQSFSLTGSSPQHVEILGVEIDGNTDRNGILISSGSDIRIDGAVISNIGNSGIALIGSPTDKLHNVVVENCRISNVRSNDGITIHENGDGDTTGSNFELRNNYAENCSEQAYDITTGSDVRLFNNVSVQNGDGGIVVGHSASDVTILFHHSMDEPTGSGGGGAIISSPGVRVAYSIFQGDGYHLLTITGNADNVEVYNNLFLWEGGNNPMDVSGTVATLAVKNNIFDSLQGSMSRVIRFLSPERPPNYATFTFDHNLYHGISTTDDRIFYDANSDSLFDFGQFQSVYGHEANGLLNDPTFVDAAGDDFHLQPGSPAVDRGQDVGLTHDFDGNQVPFGASPDIGAFEWGSSPAGAGGGSGGIGGSGGAAGSPGTGGASPTDGGTAGAPDGSTEGGGTPTAPAAAGEDDGGCGCRTAGGPTHRPIGNLALSAIPWARGQRVR